MCVRTLMYTQCAFAESVSARISATILLKARGVCVLYLHEQLSDPNYVVHHLRKVPACQRAGFLPWNTVASAIEISTKPCDITMRACHMINTGGLKQLSRTSWMRIDFFFFMSRSARPISTQVHKAPPITSHSAA